MTDLVFKYNLDHVTPLLGTIWFLITPQIKSKLLTLAYMPHRPHEPY